MRTKARTKVLKQGLQPRALTEAMRLTPRRRLHERALRGRWDRFPASPQPWYDRMVHRLGERWLHKHATFRLERRIEAVRDRNDRATANDPAARLAARRALVTYLHIAHGRLTRFGPIAARLGSDNWRPIVAMAQAALARGRADVARAVFAAADQPGMQQDFLRQRCRDLTGTTPASGTASRDC